MGLSRGYQEMGADEKHKPAAGVDDDILHVIELASHAHNVTSKDANIKISEPYIPSLHHWDADN